VFNYVCIRMDHACRCIILSQLDCRVSNQIELNILHTVVIKYSVLFRSLDLRYTHFDLLDCEIITV